MLFTSLFSTFNKFGTIVYRNLLDLKCQLINYFQEFHEFKRIKRGTFAPISMSFDESKYNGQETTAYSGCRKL